ncbi:MAG: hypothetical protein M3179_11045 [Actinomycetota bacterium]|nr:hypothetical protein [Actinomycetota bacterium]
MHTVALVVASLALWAVAVVPASAQSGTGTLDAAASSLRRDPVYVDEQAERAIDETAADDLRQRIRDSGASVFLAILPASTSAEAGGDSGQVPRELARRVNLAGTYGVVVGNSFRAGSTNLPAGRASAAATAAFQAHSGDGTEAVLADFVDRMAASSAGSGEEPGAFAGDGDTTGNEGSGDGGGSGVLLLLLLGGAGIGGFYLWQRGKRRREQAETRVELSQDRSLLDAELSVLAQDVMNLEPQVATHPDAQPDYDAAVTRYRVAQAALEQADDRIDLVRVERVIAEAHYAMSRARARIDGREPPPPPPDLQRPGRHDEPALDVDDRGGLQYVGHGAPFYGGGWFGAGGGLLTGLFLGQMLGGWGGGYHEHNVYVDNAGEGGSGDGGSDGGGDWGGDFGGGDFGGGDFGGGGDW